MSVTDNADIKMDLRARSLTANFTESEIHFAIERFGAELVRSIAV